MARKSTCEGDGPTWWCELFISCVTAPAGRRESPVRWLSVAHKSADPPPSFARKDWKGKVEKINCSVKCYSYQCSIFLFLFFFFLYLYISFSNLILCHSLTVSENGREKKARGQLLGWPLPSGNKYVAPWGWLRASQTPLTADHQGKRHAWVIRLVPSNLTH